MGVLVPEYEGCILSIMVLTSGKLRPILRVVCKNSFQEVLTMLSRAFVLLFLFDSFHIVVLHWRKIIPRGLGQNFDLPISLCSSWTAS